MDRKVWGIIIVLTALAIIAGIVYVIFFYQFSAPSEPVVEPPVVEQPTTTLPPVVNEPVEPTTTTVQPISQAKKAEVKADDLARMASAFAERFGSFSNQSDYGNIRDLQIFMNSTMKTWAENYINDARARKTQTTIYYGIVTKAIANEVKQFDADIGQAEILVKTQRRESAGVTSNSRTFYQDIIIKYVREQGVWRVDGVYWQDR